MNLRLRKARDSAGNAIALFAVALSILPVTALAQADRKREVFAYGDVRIDLISEGSGPLVVLLPSRGRDSEDFDAVAAGIARAGFRVVRPQPRGAGKSSGPMKGLTLHDFARDVASTIRHEGGGPAVVAGHAFTSGIPSPGGERVHINLYIYGKSRTPQKSGVEVVIEKFAHLP